MSRVQDQNKEFFNNYAAGSRTGENTQNAQYTTSNDQQTSNIYRDQTVYNTTYTTGGQTSYTGGQSAYNGGQGYTTYTTGNPQAESKAVNQTYQTTGYSQANYSQLGQNLTQKVVAEEIPVESRIEYIPFEKKYIEYEQVERIERIPYEREIVEYEEVTRTERVPIERTITDYYAVETQIEYIPKEIEETIVEYEPVERTWERVQYLPVQTQIVHYPERDNYVPEQRKYVQGGYTTSTVQQGATYVPSNQSGVRNQTVYQTGYVPTGSSVAQGNYGYQQGGQNTYTTGQYTTSGNTYVTGGSGVRGENVYRSSQTGKTGAYVTGGSGVRQNQ